MTQEEEIKEYNRRISNLLKNPSRIDCILFKAGIIDEQGRLAPRFGGKPPPH